MDAYKQGEITKDEMHDQLANLPEAYMPEYLGDIAVAKELGVPAVELPHQPLGLIHAAKVKLAAEAIAHRMQSTRT